MEQNKESFTIMIVPHSGKSTFSISIPSVVFKILGGILTCAAALALATIVHFSISYKHVKADAKELSIKAKDYEMLQEQLRFFVEKTHILEEKMNEIEKLDSDLRGLLKNDPSLGKKSKPEASVNISNRGVLASRGTIDRERAILMSLEKKLPEQEKSLEELKDAVIQRNERLSCTPSIRPVNGKITSAFGYRRSPFGRRREFHDGVDIAASYGEIVAATADGVVSFVGYRPGYGKTVTISHGYGFETSYCHNSSITVKVGQQVKKGQTIAKVGSTGRSTGPHVHYMVLLNGVLKNPSDYF